MRRRTPDRPSAAPSRTAGAPSQRAGAGVATLAAVVILAAAMAGCDRPEPVRATLSVSETLAMADTTGFRRAVEPRAFTFPADHGPHPEFLHEWWYFTGNVSGDGRDFGFQVTFFRNALSPEPPDVDSPWAARQAYMGHLAVADMDGGRFLAFERFQRGALGLAGAAGNPPRVWIGDWSAEVTGPEPTFAVRAAEGGVSLDLRITATRPPVLQGDEGLSRKGPEPGNASYYYSYTRMRAEGTLAVGAPDGGGDTVAVRGSAWLDREWGTSALGPDLVGWDWFSLQLDSGADLMVYRLRRRDGTTDPFSAGTLVHPDGRITRLSADDFQLRETGTWTSPTGVSYPSGWRIHVPSEGVALRVAPRLRDQELDLAFRYWEGAVAVEGRVGREPVGGVGYVELTGY